MPAHLVPFFLYILFFSAFLIRRTDIVREFRALLDGKSKNSWSNLIDKANVEMGMIDPNDSHTLLVTLAKCLKGHSPSKNVPVHPVKAAPLAIGLINRILDSADTAFRTKAGAFGLVNRLGIDWNKHLPEKNREHAFSDLKQKFMIACETAMDSSADPQSIGYACESAMYFSIHSDELNEIVIQNFRNNVWSYPPLALVQVAAYFHYINMSATDVWETLIDRIVSDLKSFTPQNLTNLLQSCGPRINALSDWERILGALASKSGTLRLRDCISVMESLALSGPDVITTEASRQIVDGIQRRAKILIVTSTVKVPVGDVLRIRSALERLHEFTLPHYGNVPVHSYFIHRELLGVS
jgi:hypothetical protein